ncbi:MAG: YgeY family selenium metabolism-linked hydrolase [Phototrophicaceae bacterium]
MTIVEQIETMVAGYREDMLAFFREIVAIPSTDSDIGAVGKRVETELHKLGYDAVWWDKMGCIVGRIGDEDADYHLLYDSHLDTVGVGDIDEWDWHPFEGKEENGVLYARGTCDEKASTPGMLYGLAIARDLGLIPDNMAVYYFGNIEEVNEGGAANAFVMTEGIHPDFVVVGEPTNLNICRGQKGRVEYQITAKGKSAHAASNHLGDNALYKLLPIIEKIKNSEPTLPSDSFLGDAKITVTTLEVQAGSRNVVPASATAYVDRRLTAGEDAYQELARIQALIGDTDDISVTIPEYDEASYTGFIFPLEMVYPTWLFDEDHPFVQAGVKTAHEFGLTPQITKWDFSTNGIYWAGKAKIPTIGYGPGEEQYAHTVLDQVRLDDVVSATKWYALLPSQLKDLQ